MDMRLIMVDECGSEIEVDHFNIGDDLDEDYLDIWKSLKIEQAKKRFPEARDFYFENRTAMNRAVMMSVHDFFGDMDYEEDEWDE